MHQHRKRRRSRAALELKNQSVPSWMVLVITDCRTCCHRGIKNGWLVLVCEGKRAHNPFHRSCGSAQPPPHFQLLSKPSLVNPLSGQARSSLSRAQKQPQTASLTQEASPKVKPKEPKSMLTFQKRQEGVSWLTGHRPLTHDAMYFSTLMLNHCTRSTC